MSKSKLVLNDFKGWQQAYEVFLSSSNSQYEITVNMSPADQPAGDVINLCYLLPLAQALYEKGKISRENKLQVNICTPTDLSNKQKSDNLYRIQVFLMLMRCKEYLDLSVDDEKLPESTLDIGRLFPLCEAVPSEDDTDGRLNTPYYLLRYSLTDLKKRFTPADLAILEITETLIRFVNEPSRYEGTRDHMIKAAQKDKLCDYVMREIDKWSREISILAFVIWMMLLRDLLETKQLFSLPGDGMADIDEVIFTKSRMDAISCGEAMYQLIENACLHSDGKRAWFGFRMHRVDTKDNQHAEARKRVLNKYDNCIKLHEENQFGEDVDRFFEFFVIDNAVSQMGMVDHFNENIFQRLLPAAAELYHSSESTHGAPLPSHYHDHVNRSKAWEKVEQDVFTETGLCRPYITHIHDLFALKPREDTKEAYIEDHSVHYGLRLLHQIVSVNGGCFQGITPQYASGTLLYYRGSADRDNPRSIAKNSSSCYVTMWSALLPLTDRWQKSKRESQFNPSINAFFDHPEPPRKFMPFLKAEKLFPDIDKNAGLPLGSNINDVKLGDIRKCREELSVYLTQSKQGELPDTLLIVESGNTLYKLEILVKSLFAQLTDLLYQQQNNLQVRIAILFPHASLVHEFIRLFSILYYNDELESMRHVQLALCTWNNDGDNNSIEPLHISCVLHGKKLSTTHDIARIFSYHYPEHTFNQLPILRYLIPKSEQAEKLPDDELEALYPFDLYLSKNISARNEEGRMVPIYESNLFLDRMQKLLMTDIQKSSYSCRIRDVHVRLGSKLHLDRFYEAELLFHDTGNIMRFAYMIVHDLLYGNAPLAKNQPVLLLGYEKYSSPLMLQIERWLKNAYRFSDVSTAIIYDDQEQQGNVLMQAYFDTESNQMKNSTQVVSVLPVGTTLSTVYKLHNTALREFLALDKHTAFSHNYCLVLIGNQTDTGTSTNAGATNHYWKSVEEANHLVHVMPECYDGNEAQVRYMIRVNASWHNPETCPLCKNDVNLLPILDVKHSETIPTAIFPLEEPHYGCFERLVHPNLAENTKRLSALLNHVRYSHIRHENDHYQFSIDFQRLYIDHQDDIQHSLSGVKVDANAFHILISPLQIANSSFVNAVITHVFNGCSRFLYFNIADAYREEVRTKFSHITQDYHNLKRYNPDVKLHIHFLDNSIISGTLINRARVLIHMLLAQSGSDIGDAKPFHSIFLLVNRSSYDTLNAYVSQPEDNVHAYIHLAVPSYNTENNMCPACRLVTKYELLQKRSSSEMLSLEFARLVKKHAKKPLHKYEAELDRDILHSSSYFSWLRQWLHVNVSEKYILSFARLPLASAVNLQVDEMNDHDLSIANTIKLAIDKYFGKHYALQEYWTIPNRHLQNVYAQRQQILRILSSTSLHDVCCAFNALPEDEREHKHLEEADLVYLVRKHLVGTRDYMRLYSLEMAYEKLDQTINQSSSDSGVKSHQRYKDALLSLISKSLCNVKARKADLREPVNDLGERRQQFLFVYNAEWLISYIKVLSRAHLNNYYPYRHAIVNIMSTIITLMASSEEQFQQHRIALEKSNKHWKKILDVLSLMLGFDHDKRFDDVYAMICYQFNITLIHRICDLQVSWVVTPSTGIDYVNMYTKCVHRYFAQTQSTSDDHRALPNTNMPTEKSAILRYLKALKTATMSSNDDIPCLKLVDIPRKLRSSTSSSTEQQNMLTALARFIEVENTRMLYSGMHDLDKLIHNSIENSFERERPSDNFKRVIAELNDSVTKCLRNCYDRKNTVYEDRHLLYQSILNNFCRFWHKSDGQSPLEALAETTTDNETNQITYMLQYFLRLRFLSDIRHNQSMTDTFPYAYEELCRSICGLSGFDMCYIAYKGDGKFPVIITQSGYYAAYMQSEKILSAANIDDLLIPFQNDIDAQFYSHSPQENNDDATAFILPCMMSYRKGCTHALVLRLTFRDDKNGNGHFFIVLHSENAAKDRLDERKALTIARNILYMRYTLIQVLSRDCAALMNYRHDASYVRPICSDRAALTPSILHLSDLHVDEKNVNQLISTAVGVLNSSFRKENPIDLLVISGDIVDGNKGNALIMETRYRCAERLLNEIVLSLWQDEMGYLSHDWRRRIVIVTGNHDYASMNQYNSVLDMRKLVAGTPIKEDTGTMSKFSYYIDFLIRYLDPPISELIRNDLNEVRHYRNLNLKLLCLNCSSLATPYRTNKMGVNRAKVEGLTRRVLWQNDPNDQHSKPSDQPYRICVSHYSPMYKLSYFRDNYSILPGYSWEDDNAPINKFEMTFRQLVQLEQQYRTNPHLDLKYALKKKEEEFQRKHKAWLDANIALKSGCDHAPNDAADKYFMQLKGSDVQTLLSEEKYPLIKYINSMLEWMKKDIDERDENDEYISRFMHDVDEHLTMGKKDSAQYSKLIQAIDDKQRIDLMLAGHIHGYKEDELPYTPTDSTPDSEERKIPIIVSDKLVNPPTSEELNGYLVTPSDADESSDNLNHRRFQYQRLSNFKKGKTK